ncbi:hypothetical protein E4H04_00475 [Candidatus Bathyarchaeota archaeon]|nr:hypothetical protein [Candidatus Bathyarchaeota archaeon]TFH19313.1 MAG: hypothetical protein E4H04_00475 [Candidatus Bathyarchaeota archaeon]
MVDLPKLDLTGFTTILAGFIFLATGLLLFVNAMSTTPNPVNPVAFKLLGFVLALVGVILLASRDE